MANIAIGHARLRTRNWRIALFLLLVLLALPATATKTLYCEERGGGFNNASNDGFARPLMFCEQESLGEHTLRKISQWLMLP